MKNHLFSLLLVVIVVTSLPCLTHALTNQEVFSQFQFNLITPGARATAMGGAFIGLADDATAVESNPAGLTILTTPEVFAEFKQMTYTVEQIYANPITLHNVNFETGSIETGITRKEFDDVVESFPFFSVVYPYKRLVFSLYRQELVNYKSSYRTSAFPIGIPGIFQALPPHDASVDLTAINYGMGIAIQPIEGLSFAISPRWSEMRIKAHYTWFGLESLIEETYPLTPTDFSEADILYQDHIDDEDLSYSMNIGVLWRPRPKISIGAVYRSGPTFVAERETVAIVEETVESYNPDAAEFTVNVPDSFGTGIAFRATDFLTVTLDVVHIRYEDILEDFDILAGTYYTTENYAVDNVTEIHLGGEYILPFGDRFFALRAGIYHEPDHTIRFTGTTGDPALDLEEKEKFPGSDDQMHITGGLGLVVSEHFQVDTAANIAAKSTQFSISAVYRF